MAEFENLSAFVDHLIREYSEDSSQRWCFFNGELCPWDTERTLKRDDKPTCNYAELPSKDRGFVMKQVSASVEANIDVLWKASNFESRRSEAFVRTDIESIVRYFDYYARWPKKILQARVAGIGGDVIRESIPCVISDDCPIFATLSRFTASIYGSLNNVALYVDKRYWLPALTFAFLVHKAGILANEVNVYPLDHPSFPKKISRGNIGGVVPVHSLKSIEYKICWQLNISNIYFKNRNSACPFLILKSADVDSAVKSLMKSTRDLEVLWFPNVIYVEEPVYKRFLDILKFAVNQANRSTEPSLSSTRLEHVKDEISRKNGGGYEVITLHHLFHSCLFIVDYAFSAERVADEKNDDEQRTISIVPIRYDSDGVAEMNKQKGLCASVWSNDLVQATSLPLSLKYGTVWMNCAGYYDPSVPLALWGSHGVGSLSGKRMIYENSRPYSFGTYPIHHEWLYDNERNSTLPKRTLSDIVKKSTKISESWNQIPFEERLRSLYKVAKLMEKDWDTRYKKVLDRTPDDVWKKCVHVVKFWPVYISEKVYEQTLFVHNCLVMCKSEPVGIVAIMAGTMDLDKIMFYIAAALAYGNVVVVGFSTDEPSAAIAVELEKLFDEGLVSVLMDTRVELWRQFTTNSSIATLWVYFDAESTKTPHLTTPSPQIVYNLHADAFQPCEEVAERIEMLVTRAKSVWFPHLGRAVDEPRLSY